MLTYLPSIKGAMHIIRQMLQSQLFSLQQLLHQMLICWTRIKREVNPLHPLHHQRVFVTPQQPRLPQFQLAQWHLQMQCYLVPLG